VILKDAVGWVIDLPVFAGQIEGYSQGSIVDSLPAGSVLNRMFRQRFFWFLGGHWLKGKM
jgi:hypothetical protein